MTFMVRYHAPMELVAYSTKLQEEAIKFFTEAKETKLLTQHEALSIAKIWTCFRIAERATSEIFGFMDKKFFHEDYIVPMYEKLKGIIDQIY